MDGNYIITSNGNFISEDELYHWGIKGMKWGVRRYQNADGSLTAAGRRRYTNPDGSLNDKGKKYYAKEETSKHKTAKEMTDEELDKAIARAKKEDEYNRLRPEPVKKSGFMEDLVTNVVKPAVIQSGKNMLVSVMDKAVKDLMKDKIDPNSYEALKKTYDTLKLKADIEDLKNRKPGETKTPEIKTWDDLIKSKQYENDRRAETLDAREKDIKEREDAVKAREDAAKTKGNASNNGGGSNNSGSGSKSPKETESKGKSSVDKIIGSDYSGSYTTASEYYSKDHEKRVDSLLDKIDNIGWDQYYKERGGK